MENMKNIEEMAKVWRELNKEECDTASSLDMSGWREIDDDYLV